MYRKEALQEFEELKKKYKELPALEEIESELDIFIDRPPVLTTLLGRLYDTFQNISRHYMVVVQPSSYIDAVESDFYKEDESEKIKEQLKQFLFITHNIISAFYSDDKKRAEVFMKYFKLFRKEYKEMARKFFSEQAELWKKYEFKAKKSNSYMG